MSTRTDGDGGGLVDFNVRLNVEVPAKRPLYAQVSDDDLYGTGPSSRPVGSRPAGTISDVDFYRPSVKPPKVELQPISPLWLLSPTLAAEGLQLLISELARSSDLQRMPDGGLARSPLKPVILVGDVALEGVRISAFGSLSRLSTGWQIGFLTFGLGKTALGFGMAFGGSEEHADKWARRGVSGLADLYAGGVNILLGEEHPWVARALIAAGAATLIGGSFFAIEKKRQFTDKDPDPYADGPGGAPVNSTNPYDQGRIMNRSTVWVPGAGLAASLVVQPLMNWLLLPEGVRVVLGVSSSGNGALAYVSGRF